MDPMQPQQTSTNQPIPELPQQPIAQPYMQPQQVAAVPQPQPAPLPPTPNEPVVFAPQQPALQPAPQVQQPMPQQPIAQQPTYMPMSAPIPTMQPQPMSFNSMPSDGKKKKLILGGAIAGAAVLIVIGVIAFSSMMGVSKEDYRKASTSASTTSSELSDLNLALIKIDSSYSTETEMNNNIDTAKNAIKEYKEAADKLGLEKAAKKGEASKLYTTFKDKNDKFVALADAYIESVGKLMIVLQKCQESDKNSTEASTTVIGNCISDLSAVTDVKDPDVKSFLDTSIAMYKEVKTVLEKYNATPASNYTVRSQLRTQYYDLSSSYRTKARDFTSNVEKKFDDADPYEQLQAYYNSVFEASLKN